MSREGKREKERGAPERRLEIGRPQGTTGALPEIGWREWVALPGLEIARIKAKVDTGARSSALHAFDIEIFRRAGKRLVRFKVHPNQRDSNTTVLAEAPVFDERHVRNSGGRSSLRPVIHTEVTLKGQKWLIELTLVGRDEMGFRMLLGREAVRGRFLVDPARSFLGGKPEGGIRKRRRGDPGKRGGDGKNRATRQVGSKKRGVSKR